MGSDRMDWRRKFLRRFSKRSLLAVVKRYRDAVRNEPAVHRTAAWWLAYYQRSVAELLLIIWAGMGLFVGFRQLGDGLSLWFNTSSPRSYAFIVEVNSADWPELTCLPGIGEILAKRIVMTRQEMGSFSRSEDLRTVKGIGPKTVRKIAPFLRFNNDRPIERLPATRK